jgi:hypothetical protein
VEKMQRLRRGRNLVSPESNVYDVRLKRHLKDEKRSATGHGRRPLSLARGSGTASEY